MEDDIVDRRRARRVSPFELLRQLVDDGLGIELGRMAGKR